MENNTGGLRGSFFVVDDEGATHRVLTYPGRDGEPDRLVTALGEPVRLNPDGTYTLLLSGKMARCAR